MLYVWTIAPRPAVSVGCINVILLPLIRIQIYIRNALLSFPFLSFADRSQSSISKEGTSKGKWSYGVTFSPSARRSCTRKRKRYSKTVHTEKRREFVSIYNNAIRSGLFTPVYKLFSSRGISYAERRMHFYARQWILFFPW